MKFIWLTLDDEFCIHDVEAMIAWAIRNLQGNHPTLQGLIGIKLARVGTVL